MIIREKEPANLELPFGLLDGFSTTNEQCYIRYHFPVPELDLSTWRLEIDGAVEQPRAWSYDELRALPQKTIPATLECAGNSRVFLVPKVKGTQWELGAIGNAERSGVSLGELLKRQRSRRAPSRLSSRARTAARSRSRPARRAGFILPAVSR